MKSLTATATHPSSATAAPRMAYRAASANLGDQQTAMAVASFGRSSLGTQSWSVSSPSKQPSSTTETCPYCGELGYHLTFEDHAFGVQMLGACDWCGVRAERFLPGWRSPGGEGAAAR